MPTMLALGRRKGMLRFALVAFVLGTAWVHGLPAVPPAWASALAGVAVPAACAAWGRARPGCRRHRRAAVLLAVAAFAAGSALALTRIDLRLQDGLSPAQENVPLELEYLVTSLSTATAAGQRFEATVLDPPAGVPGQVQLSWWGRAAEVVPGERWRGTVLLRRPHGTLNPHGFDYEAYLFEHGIRATGSVRGQPSRLADDAYASFDVAVQRARHVCREALRRALEGKRYGAVLAALAMGDQAGVDRRDWDIFNRTGITHLVSISGLHVTMLAALAGWAVLQAWKRCRWDGIRLPERHPAQVAAAGAALAVAWLYCLLAGWGVPARRTFFMLAVVAGAAAWRVPVSGSRVLALAAALVCALDPWATLAAGFWLSFGAVALLILCGGGRWRQRDGPAPASAWPARVAASVREGARAQAALTVGLLPALALLFQQVSLVSPLANAVAIPVVSLLVTPLALAALALSVAPGLEEWGAATAAVAHAVFEGLMVPLQWLADTELAAVSLAAPPWPLFVLALAGVVWTLQPRGLPGRWLGLVLLVPMLAYRPARPAPGEWRLAMLDVGQGTAIVVETASATLLYDTGPPYGDKADAGGRVVWPYLRARGIRRLDDVVVSHADADHAGGLRSVLAALPAARVHASYDLASADIGQAVFSRCAAGQRWTVDGVAFEFLHPASPRGEVPARARNAHSCVLRVRGTHHAALLAGDIGAAEEAGLAAVEDLAADVVAAPHHGSRGSSSPALVAATRASHVVAQAGYLNRYRHPHPDAERRWRRAGAVFHRTDRHGALVFVSRQEGLRVARERESRRRYWHTAP
ncbi:DNA internalization-related competence protein ComEC/Rec2 [Pigmentiphaga sp. GD03639]|uniref:DNA internalization-related competence protein ComEC/Rec2 n=1 Tax=Pigmentiphaga sp. GD03639 TaxID=2975354 RepID=UPI00244945C6|nr:DNA internalization-related competence protein ComEC/Rec2 [Pigmentiphaga sp. GD03639]MDH2236891.1 DNA internalization-related competence protein ComEC/Rec2 [Pigmentiphaga sp. GD03639]